MISRDRVEVDWHATAIIITIVYQFIKARAIIVNSIYEILIIRGFEEGYNGAVLQLVGGMGLFPEKGLNTMERTV